MSDKLPNTGTYLAKHKLFHHNETLTVYRGNIRDEKGTKINPLTFHELWLIIQKLPSPNNTFNILWCNGGKETIINVRASYGIVLSKIKQLKASSHKSGILMTIKCTE